MTDDVQQDGGEGAARKSGGTYREVLIVLAGGFAMALVIIAIGVVAKGDGGGGGGDAASSTPIPVSLVDFKIEGALQVAPGGQLAVTNNGSQVHNLVIDGGGQTADLAVGKSETIPVDLGEGDYTVFCSIAGHREAGMETTMQVAEGATAPAATEAAHAGHGDDMTAAEYAEMDTLMEESFTPFVDMVTSGEPNTKGLGGQTLEPTIAADGAKEWTLTAAITDWEVSPGKIVKAWTYNGMVPGPTLRGEVGDRIRVKVINNLPMATDVHMHGMILPNEMDGVAPLTQDLIQPGEEFTYEYTVTDPAIAMYHPHHHGQMTVPNGMWGSMIFSPKGGGGTSEYTIPRGSTVSGVQIPADLKVAQEHNMVLNDAGVIGLSLKRQVVPRDPALRDAAG